jgi:hypothetical protein
MDSSVFGRMCTVDLSQVWAVAETSTAPLQRLDAVSRLRIVSALAVTLTAAGLLLLFIRASARVTRWYIHQPPRPTRCPGDPLAKVIDGKPRLWRREWENWRRPR